MMRVKSTHNPYADAKDIPGVSILVLVRTNLNAPTEPLTVAILGRAFVLLPETFQGLADLARATFKLPQHSSLRVMTDCLDVCQGAPVDITVEAYGPMRRC
ncbi:hypothetical protein BD779DRAFT_1672698 [Infundibulicybe gibba]|nr:hypothetical protein BD779DRAFT_1672698 [Infundibulicybe gibba]